MGRVDAPGEGDSRGGGEAELLFGRVRRQMKVVELG